MKIRIDYTNGVVFPDAIAEESLKALIASDPDEIVLGSDLLLALVRFMVLRGELNIDHVILQDGTKSTINSNGNLSVWPDENILLQTVSAMLRLQSTKARASRAARKAALSEKYVYIKKSRYYTGGSHSMRPEFDTVEEARAAADALRNLVGFDIYRVVPEDGGHKEPVDEKALHRE